MTELLRASANRRLVELEAVAQRARGRFERYREKLHSRGPASHTELRKLRRDCESAEQSLTRAQGAVREAKRSDTEERERVESARIETELKRDPNRPDTKIARASGSPFIAVRAVRDRLGLYPERLFGDAPTIGTARRRG